MGLFDKIFNHREEPITIEKPTSPVISGKIECIISILQNLSLMNKDTIREYIQDKEYFDEEILSRLTINQPKNIEYLEKYFGKVKFGYGDIKLNQFRNQLKAIAREKTLANASEDTIINDLLTITSSEIIFYEGILIRFNETLKKAEEKSSNYNELLDLIEQCKNYFKEQELGYPVSLDKKLEEMKRELRELPYGGYGEEEINKFQEAAKKMMEEAKLAGEDSNHTLSRIQTDLFVPKKNRYLVDVDNLQRKLEMIDESPYISSFDKEKNKQQTILEFNQMNGKKIEKEQSLEELKQNLVSLEYGGYGEEIINQFERRVKTMISDGERIKKPAAEVQKEIMADYQKLMNHYQDRLNELKEKLAAIDPLAISEDEKNKMKSQLVEEFHDEMGLPINDKERINTMILELKGLDRGGYGELKIEEFKTKAFDRLNNTSSRVELRDALKEIRELQTHMIAEYKEDLRRLYDATERISHDRHLSDEEKQRAIEEFDREFKFKIGYRMNFGKYIENRAEELSTLPGGGYGKEAIDVFRTDAQVIADGYDAEKTKYDKIHLKFKALKKQYNTNLKVFREWKKIELDHTPEKERENREKDLNIKIAYMLSLSPSALREYYLEDDRKKKEEIDKHNYIAAYKFLAKKEAKNKQSDSLYEQRIQELEQGSSPYTKHELEEATAELKYLSLTSEELADDERIITLVEYIDSTLLRQMMYVEASLMKSDSNH